MISEYAVSHQSSQVTGRLFQNARVISIRLLILINACRRCSDRAIQLILICPYMQALSHPRPSFPTMQNIRPISSSPPPSQTQPIQTQTPITSSPSHNAQFKILFLPSGRPTPNIPLLRSKHISKTLTTTVAPSPAPMTRNISSSLLFRTG